MRASLAAIAAYVALGSAQPQDQVPRQRRGPHYNTPVERSSTPYAVASNGDGSLALSSVSAPVSGHGSPGSESTWELYVDNSGSGIKQTITGIGACVTDSTVTSFNTLSEDTLSELLNTIMTSDGANFSLMRHTIGASDLSGDPAYTYDDNGGQPDPDFNSFNLGGRGNAMAQMLAKMSSIQPDITIFGSSWSPPGWMKLNGVIDGNTTDNNLNDGYLTNNGPDYSQQFADYFVKYIQAYEAQGAHIDAITIQNEPLNSQAGYPTMYMFSYEQADLINGYVAPALSDAGLDTKIWAYDHNTNEPSFPQVVLQNAGQNTDTVAWHCYDSPNWTVLTDFNSEFPGVSQYMTECWTPTSLPWTHVLDFTMSPLQNWAKGVVAWDLGTNTDDGPHLSTGGCSDCTGLVVISSDGTYQLQTSYYIMAQFSKYIPPGAQIYSGSGSAELGSGGIQSVASLNPDGTRTVVISNTYGNDVYTHVHFTSSGEEWSGNIASDSVTTWVLPSV